MTEDADQEFRFFVYVVESPSAPDLYHGRSEGTLVAQAAALDSVPCVSRTAINREAFGAALTIGLPEAMKQYPDRLPILHLSAHGASTGLQLSDGEIVKWADLRAHILPINVSLNGNLFVCMSACEGYSACQMAMQSDDGPHPYFAIIANFGTPTWSDTAVAYSAFYHLLAKGSKVVDAVEAMKAASGDDRWVSETAEEAKQGWLEYLKKVDLPKAQEKLEQAADAADLPSTAKALEHSASG